MQTQSRTSILRYLIVGIPIGVIALMLTSDGSGRLGLPGWMFEPPTTEYRRPQTAEEFLAAYPLESLRHRLAYETRLEKSSEPRLTEQSELDLRKFDLNVSFSAEQNRRLSLRLLHESRSLEFTRRPGFGMARHDPGFPEHLRLDGKSIRLPYRPSVVDTEYTRPLLNLDTNVRVSGESGRGIPSLKVLEDDFARRRFAFLFPQRFGYAQSVDRVSGFNAHGLRSNFTPLMSTDLSWFTQPIKAPKESTGESWILARFELISLLRHETAVAYLSDYLPDLERLNEFDTRPLNEFESRALKQLESGEHIAIEARRNVIQMLGPLRASQQCMTCHDVGRGTLLGAFSYELHRNPLIGDPPNGN